MHRTTFVAAKVYVQLLILLGVSYSTIAAAQDNDDGYHVQPGDILEISVWKELDLDREVLVRPDGGISFPLAGDVSARGKTVEELRIELTNRLIRYIPDLSVTIAVKEHAFRRVRLHVLDLPRSEILFTHNRRSPG